MNNEERDKLIKEIHNKSHETNTKVCLIESKCIPCQERVGKLDVAVRGNGKRGLAERVGKLEFVLCTMVGSCILAGVWGGVAWIFGQI